MKTKLTAIIVAIFVVCNPIARAGSITWTNSLGGNWSDANNWSPNLVPSSGDDAVITNNGTYNLTLDIAATVGSLTLGGNNGHQTLLTAGNSLTLNNSSLINSNGIVNLTSDFNATFLTVRGQFTWTSGNFSGITSVATNGTFVIASPITHDLHGVITNAGIVNLSGTTFLRCFGDVGQGELINVAGGIMDIQGDGQINLYAYSSEFISNQGILRKSGGTGTSYIYPALYNAGTLDVQSGTLVTAGGDGAGVFKSQPGATLNFGNGYTVDAGGLITGSGTNLLTGSMTINGIINSLSWTGGNLYGTPTIPTNAILTVSGPVTHDFYGVITNAGTIALTEVATLRCVGANGFGEVINLPGGLVDIKDDGQIAIYAYPTEAVFNQGLIRKSGGTGTSTISVLLYNSGTLDAQSGSLVISGGDGAGIFKSQPGATLNFGGTYTLDAGGLMTGTGTNLLAGSMTINGIIANLTWNSGNIYGYPTVATNGLLQVNSPTTHDIYGVVTNAGTVALINAGVLRCVGATTQGQLINLAGGLLDIQTDGQIALYAYPTEAVYNQGTIRKSSGTNISYIYPALYNNGTLDVQVGTLGINGGEGGGVFRAEAGTTLSYGFSSIVDNTGSLTGIGTHLFTSGTISLNGCSIPAPNLILAGATLACSNIVVGGTLNWLSGTIAGTMTMAPNSLMTVNGPVYHEDYGIITNAGTLQISAGSIFRCVGANGFGELVNLAGGLVDLQADGLLALYAYPSEIVFNQGTIRKSGATGTSYINPLLYNAGTLDVQTGTLVIASGAGAGIFKSQAGATLSFGASTYSVDVGGVIAGTGTNLVAAGLTINGIISNLTWTAGTLSGNPTISTNGLMLVTGATYHDFYGTITNAGTIRMTDTAILRTVGAAGQGLLINLAGGLVDMQGDGQISLYAYPTESVYNQGTIRKSGGTNTSYIYPAFYNSGTLDVQAGIMSVQTSYNLPGSHLNFGINSLTNYGKISMAGSVALTGTVSANLNNGFYPVASNSFDVLAYGSQTGNFTNYVLPPKQAWSTNYGATIFNLTVLNSAPILPAQTNRAINELTLLTVTNTAVDYDLPPNTLVYTFLAAPTNASISAAGVITWTPNEAQGPSTNTFITKVTDNGIPSLSETNTFSVIVYEINTAPVLPAQTNLTINELTTLIVTNTAVDSDLPVNTLTYTLLLAPTNAVINTNGVITWTPTEAQGPSTNSFTTVVTDTNIYAINTQSLSATNTFTVVVNEVNVAPVLTLPANTNINEMVAYSATATATDSDLPVNTLTFALVSGPTGLTVSTSGIINWTPTEAQGPSTNTVTISVSDTNVFAVNAKSLSVTNSYQIIVNEVNVAPVLPTQTNMVINELATLVVTNTASDSDIPTNLLTYSLLAAPASASISTNGIITWVTTEADGPSTNTFTTKVIDNGSPSLSATNTFTVVVNEVNVAPVLGALSNFTVNPGQTIGFTATATDADLPVNTLTFALVSPPAGATISGAGVFSWRPATALANTTNILKVQVTDSNPAAVNSQHLSNTNSFTVIVRPLAPVMLTSLGYTNGQFKLQVSGTTGPDYIISGSTNLTSWSDLFTNLSPATPFQYADTNAAAFGHRFYRARLSP